MCKISFQQGTKNGKCGIYYVSNLFYLFYCTYLISPLINLEFHTYISNLSRNITSFHISQILLILFLLLSTKRTGGVSCAINQKKNRAPFLIFRRNSLSACKQLSGPIFTIVCPAISIAKHKRGFLQTPKAPPLFAQDQREILNDHVLLTDFPYLRKTQKPTSSSSSESEHIILLYLHTYSTYCNPIHFYPTRTNHHRTRVNILEIRTILFSLSTRTSRNGISAKSANTNANCGHH